MNAEIRLERKIRGLDSLRVSRESVDFSERIIDPREAAERHLRPIEAVEF